MIVVTTPRRATRVPERGVSRRCVAVAATWALACLVSPAGARADESPRNTAEMVRRVDELLADAWAKSGVEPAPLSSDPEFVRRIYLDLTGIIPTAAEARAFLADASADKRARLIEALLVHPRHATHLANLWRNTLVVTDDPNQQPDGVVGLQNWLRDRFAENGRYDNLVADLLMTQGNSSRGGPAVYFTAQELKPEEIAGSTARIFMGVQIQCAQCHDHPFDHWSQRDFWGYAAFFARLPRSQQPGMNTLRLVDMDTGEVTLPGASEPVSPRFLGGEQPGADVDANRRRQLAIWTVSRDNPYFARAAVNRIWAHLFAQGLVEPLDDLGDHNPASHPELLKELADYFSRTNYDLREIRRVLVSTRAYQLSSQLTDASAAQPPELFARMPLKPLSGEQLYDSLARIVGPRAAAAGAMASMAMPSFLNPARLEFVGRFSGAAGSSDYQAGIPQVLTLMNGQLMSASTDPESSDLLSALEAPLFSDDQRLETLFLATLSRPMSDEERSMFTEFVAKGGGKGDRRQALADALWALLNSSEFAFNH